MSSSRNGHQCIQSPLCLESIFHGLRDDHTPWLSHVTWEVIVLPYRLFVGYDHPCVLNQYFMDIVHHTTVKYPNFLCWKIIFLKVSFTWQRHPYSGNPIICSNISCCSYSIIDSWYITTQWYSEAGFFRRRRFGGVSQKTQWNMGSQLELLRVSQAHEIYPLVN